MVNELDKKLVSKENRPLDKYVDLTKDYDDDFITLSAAHIEDAKYGEWNRPTVHSCAFILLTSHFVKK